MRGGDPETSLGVHRGPELGDPGEVGVQTPEPHQVAFQRVAAGLETRQAMLMPHRDLVPIRTGGCREGLVVEVTRVARTTDGLLDVIVRYTNNGSAAYRFPNRGSASSQRI